MQPDTDSIVVCWRTHQAASTLVHWGLTSRYGQQIQIPGAREQHQVHLKKLSPGTTYHYRVLSRHNGQTLFDSGDATFQTASSASTSGFRAVVLGSLEAPGLRPNWSAQLLQHQPQLVLDAGNAIQRGSELSDWKALWSQDSKLWSQTPILPAFGPNNYLPGRGSFRSSDASTSHEVWSLPGHRSWYETRREDTLFVTLDTNHLSNPDTSDAQLSWLDGVLSRATDTVNDPTFLVVLMHAPPASTVTTPRTRAQDAWIQSQLVPRFCRYGVDLVLSSRDEIYERIQTPSFTSIQVCSRPSPSTLNTPSHPQSRSFHSGHSSALLLEFRSGSLHFRALTPSGSVLDSGTINARSRTFPQIKLPIFQIPQIDYDQDNGIEQVFYQALDSKRVQITAVFRDEDHTFKIFGLALFDLGYDAYRSNHWRRIRDVESFIYHFDTVASWKSGTPTRIEFPGSYAGSQQWDVMVAQHYAGTFASNQFQWQSGRPIIHVNTWNHMFGPKNNNPSLAQKTVATYSTRNGDRRRVESLYRQP
jgi:hypothetical protein